jgi:DnaJ family protein C protein 10
MHRWLADYLPSPIVRLGNDFFERVLNSKDAWLIDFYAPWCGHCIVFAPEFERIAQVCAKKTIFYGS